MKGTFIVSLDFELMWGMLDIATYDSYGKNILAVHTVLPKLLDLFQKYDVHATIAYVGFLGFENKEELLQAIPSQIPTYTNEKLSPYRDHFSYLTDERYFFAPRLVELIRSTPHMELGTHTFSHYYCTEKGQTIGSFEQDIKQATKQTKGLSSIIFPRNQVTDDYLHVLPKYGIKVYRGNPQKFFKTNGGLAQRLLRIIDAFVNVSGYNTYDNKSLKSEIPINIPASRFLRSYDSKLALLDFLKFRRIKRAMSHAASKGEMFHLWWHPHNFGANTEENLCFLEKILRHYTFLKRKYNFQSMNMGEYADEITNDLYNRGARMN